MERTFISETAAVTGVLSYFVELMTFLSFRRGVAVSSKVLHLYRYITLKELWHFGKCADSFSHAIDEVINKPAHTCALKARANRCYDKICQIIQQRQKDGENEKREEKYLSMYLKYLLSLEEVVCVCAYVHFTSNPSLTWPRVLGCLVLFNLMFCLFNPLQIVCSGFRGSPRSAAIIQTLLMRLISSDLILLMFRPHQNHVNIHRLLSLSAVWLRASFNEG